MNTYRIPAEHLADFERRITKLANRADFLGLAPIDWNTLSVEVVDKDDHAYEVHLVEVIGGRPIIEGWEFIGVINHGPDNENIVLRVPGSDSTIDLTHYRTVDPWCDHCNLNRRRNDTYIVRRTGLEGFAPFIQQVGSSCLKDFIGHGDPQKIAAFAELLIDFDQYALANESEYNEGGGGGKFLYNTTRFLAYTVLAISRYGWLSRTKAREQGLDGQATANAIENGYGKGFWEGDNWGRYGSYIQPSDSDYAEAEEALAWIRSDEVAESSEYMYTMRTLAKRDYFEPRFSGYVASLVNLYRNEMRKKIEREKMAATSDWIGTIKERRPFDLTVTYVKPGVGDFLSTLYVFVDNEGNRVKWFSSNDKGWSQGDTVSIVATVKKHEEYNGVKETTITNGKEISYDK